MEIIDKHIQERELEHPIRLRIWQMFEMEPGRSLLPSDLVQDMEIKKVTVAQVSYHLRRLQRAGMVAHG